MTDFYLFSEPFFATEFIIIFLHVAVYFLLLCLRVIKRKTFYKLIQSLLEGIYIIFTVYLTFLIIKPTNISMVINVLVGGYYGLAMFKNGCFGKFTFDKNLEK